MALDRANEVDLADILLRLVNDERVKAGVKEIGNASMEVFSTIFTASSKVVVPLSVNESEGDEFNADAINGVALGALEQLFAGAGPGKDDLLAPVYTHFDAKITRDADNNSALNLILFKRYLDLEEVGPLIDGDLVVQGTTTNLDIGPAICIIEFASDEEENFNTISTIFPWQMMFTASPSDGATNTFAIPISVGSDFQDGTVRVKVFADNIASIPYNDQPETSENGENSYVVSENMILALEFTTRATSSFNNAAIIGEGSVANDFDAQEHAFYGDTGHAASLEHGITLLSKELKIAVDYDDVSAFMSDGYDLHCIKLSEMGVESDPESVWKFHILGKPISMQDAMVADNSSEPSEGHSEVVAILEGICDIQWLTAPKSMGEIPKTEHYETLHDFDLSGVDDEHSVYLALRHHKMHVKRAGSAEKPQSHDRLISRIFMVAATNVSIIHEYIEKHFPHYQETIEFKPAPADLCRSTAWTDLGGGEDIEDAEKQQINKELSDHVAGLIVEYVPPSTVLKYTHRTASSQGKRVSGLAATGEVTDLASDFDGFGMADKFQEEEVFGDDADKENEAGVDMEAGDDEMSRVTDDEHQDDDINEQHREENLLKRIDELMNEKIAMQEQNLELQKKALQLYSREKAMQVSSNTKSDHQGAEAANNDDNNNAAGANATSAETEKGRAYREILNLIYEGKAKLHKQEQDFDNIASDLQTKLDDKEFKANEINERFKEFKREILEKAVNSRTGKPMGSKLIKYYEVAELKREEDLEKVRLRNITMRMTLKKLERQLKAREQVAEGLYMIDFEQLKIENQTLNEKIEERDEELTKLKRKKTVTVQVLTHIREKLFFVEASNKIIQKELDGVEEVIVAKRGDLTAHKKDRDNVKFVNKELRRKQGFATNESLLRDFEKRKSSLENIQAQIQECKDRCKILQGIIMSNSQIMEQKNSNFGMGLLAMSNGSMGDMPPPQSRHK